MPATWRARRAVDGKHLASPAPHPVMLNLFQYPGSNRPGRPHPASPLDRRQALDFSREGAKTRRYDVGKKRFASPRAALTSAAKISVTGPLLIHASREARPEHG